MAYCFELVINFGDNMHAARSALLTCASGRTSLLTAGDRRIPIHGPILRSDGPYLELSLLPVGVGFGVALDGSLPGFTLTAAELTELGHGMYELLTAFDGYVAARVGWDPEDTVDPVELEADWLDELRDGAISGLVLCDALHAELGLGDDYAVFQPGYRWMPYRGEVPDTLTTDPQRGHGRLPASNPVGPTSAAGENV
ncbi:hypothetical protein [Nocardia vulneris]|uniref:DUF4262 domain-containing protein n=1 Tax=Nocardia vulneris TaxID=1141657 RepID=A0ABR4ZI94_9NOCA|nr:hypothetical protein [Nocardia vulneris]KIA64934.1 hypothetical protein FG87_10135 [Nocardia vulneris]